MRYKVLSRLAAALSLCLAQAALAADMPAKLPVAAPVYNWTGFYIGGNIGYGWGKSDNDFADAVTGFATVPMGSDTTNVNGVIGGLQAGYNWQTDSFVFGVETDVQMSGQKISGTAVCPTASCGPGGTVTHTEQLTWFGTTRSRLGWAFDRWLAYGTGGVAYGAVKSSGSVNFFVPLRLTGPYSGSTTRVGWVAGAGLEGAITRNWSARVEYLYIDFGTANFSSPTTFPLAAGAITDSMHLRDNIVRVGLNYRF